MTRKQYTERLSCLNWDSEVPLKLKVSQRAITRIVRTKGVKIICSDAFGKIITHLRSGYEVRIADTVYGEQLRLYPTVLKDMKTVVVSAQVLRNSDLRNCLNDKKVVLMRQKSDIKTVADAKQVFQKTYERRKNMVYVSPDKIVKCPKCGTNIRVGKHLSGSWRNLTPMR